MKDTIQITYKSGRLMTMKVDTITVKTGSIDGALRSVEWDGVSPNGNRPLFLNIDEIESIWKVTK